MVPLVLKCHMALCTSGTNFIYERRVLMFIIYHNRSYMYNIRIHKLAKLVAEADTDCSANPDYLENRFVTNDGFEIGYYVSKGKANW